MDLPIHRQFGAVPAAPQLSAQVKRRFGLYGTAIIASLVLLTWSSGQIGAVQAASQSALGTSQTAIAAAQAQALQRSPLSFSDLLTKAVAMLDTPNHSLGIVMLKEAVRRNPQSRDAAVQLGYAYLRIGDLDKAKITLEHAKDVDPLYPETYKLLANLYTKLGQKDVAAAALEHAQQFAQVPGVTN